MTQKKRNRTWYLRLCLVGILCPLLLLLGIGAVQGRYRNQMTTEVTFQSTQNQQIYIWNGAAETTETEETLPTEASTETTPTEENAETLQPLEGWSQTEPGKAVLNFQVTNGTADNFCSEPLRFCVRVAASLGIQNPENVTMTLQIGEKKYTAKATQIQEGSTRFVTFGPGWVYGFYDSNDMELTWELLGGRLSKVDAVLTVEGSGDYTSLLRMEVTGFQDT